MILLNEQVEHVSYGFGIVTEGGDNKISVQFKEGIGRKTFIYPDAFERFLKAVKPEVSVSVLEELQAKQQQELELRRLEKEREAAGLEERRSKLTTTKKEPQEQ